MTATGGRQALAAEAAEMRQAWDAFTTAVTTAWAGHDRVQPTPRLSAHPGGVARRRP